ncbi:heavy-metal-associated domain-containing protein [Microcoleus sp. FACHB-68]|uniref:heavy-metal-associated domain-containing protein n=1 Tax=Microcoleus sp. FACHB-68 TaxID=2692826 RepID=UPI00168340B0|nr:heavy-metal-associated domain-containing protein [Microcoleus sp. FACHB-68]MBD1938429.1 heavy-metal-associated domain-containing protein [Microcoleus sp. FACHB-68]
MALKLNVPSIVCQGCADSITEAIKTIDPDASIQVDVPGKTVTLDSQAAEESFKQAITAIGHKVEE